MTSSCLQDAEQVLLGQIASPDAAASVVVAVTSGLGLAPALQASLELTAVQVIQKALHLFVIQSKNSCLHCYTVTVSGRLLTSSWLFYWKIVRSHN